MCVCSRYARTFLAPPKLAVVAEGNRGQAIVGLTAPVLRFMESYPSISAFSFADNRHFLIIVSIDFCFLPDLICHRSTFEFKVARQRRATLLLYI